MVEIAPFISEKNPRINTPKIYGASPKRPFIYRLPVSGERPMDIKAKNLPQGLFIENGIITGQAEEKGEYEVIITAENRFGTDEKKLVIEIADNNICRTPLMGWTSWNTYAHTVTQEKIKNTAELLISTGLADYGYSYVNIDSTWQGDWGGKYNAVMANEKFPDMGALCDNIHEKGLKCGIYSTPMLNAWGLEKCGFGLHGTTCKEPDPRFASTMGGIGTEHHEAENLHQWEDWGFDYLKYDWDPTDIENAGIMRQLLSKSKRDFVFSATVRADFNHPEFWATNCSSWRDNFDSADNFERVTHIFESAERWHKYVNPGHFFDLDMLETGYYNNHYSNLTEDEQIFAVSLRALFGSPMQISCDLSKLTDFTMSLYCNNEIIAVNQDTYCGAVCVSKMMGDDDDYKVKTYTAVYKKALRGGGTAVGFFNLGAEEKTLGFALDKETAVRDCWAKKDLGVFEDEISLTLAPHTARIIRID